MPIFEVTAPDGKVYEVNGPEGSTKEQALSRVKSHYMARSQVAQDNITRGAQDFTGDMSFGQQFLAGAGKRFSDLALGAKQIFGGNPQPTLSSLVVGNQPNEADQKRALDRALMETPGAGVGSLATDLAITLPAIGVPALGTVRGAAALGAGMSALNPVGSNESRAMNMAVGGALGAGGALAGNLVGKLFQPVKSTLSPEAMALADKAVREGIPLDAAAITGSKPLQIANSVLEQLPFTSAVEAAKKTATQEGFTNAVLSRAGMGGRVADPAALAAQKTALGQTMEGIAGANTLDFNKGLVGELASIASEAAKRGKTASEPIVSTIDSILAEVNNAGVMGGKNYQAWRQMLRPLAQSGGPDSHLYGQIRTALDKAFNSQIQGTGQAAAWNQANREYANLKTILEAAGGAGNQAAQNQIAPSQLATAVRNAIGKEGNALGRGDLNELSRIGQLFVKDQIPNSGTAQRALIQGILTGGAGGLGGYFATGNDPTKTAGMAAGAAAIGLGSPVVAQAILNNPALQAYLIRSASSPIAGILAQAASRGGGLAGVLSSPNANNQ